MNRTRSWLFVPADSPRKIEKALTLTVDNIILDLEDAVLPTARPAARALVAETLARYPNHYNKLCVRINPWDSEDALHDLRAMGDALPAMIMLPKVNSGSDLVELDAALSRFERENGDELAKTKVIALVTETAAMTATLPAMSAPPKRVIALTWGGEDLSAEIGAMTNKDDNGHWLPVFEYARVQCLLAAKRFGLLAIDTIFSDFKNTQGMVAHSKAAIRDGFDGLMAIHPQQVDSIHGAFHPSTEDIAQAQAIVAAFETQENAGAVQLDGRMLDRPHLVQARKILDRAD